MSVAAEFHSGDTDSDWRRGDDLPHVKNASLNDARWSESRPKRRRLSMSSIPMRSTPSSTKSRGRRPGCDSRTWWRTAAPASILVALGPQEGDPEDGEACVNFVPYVIDDSLDRQLALGPRQRVTSPQRARGGCVPRVRLARIIARLFEMSCTEWSPIGRPPPEDIARRL